MGRPETLRRLIVNADDFGRSTSINQAVVRAHREGILTTASLMVNGSAFEEAVELAREHPTLGVGLHLTLICGTATLKPDQIPGLVNDRGQFSDHPAGIGLRYFLSRNLENQLRAEVAAQFNKFRSTGLPMDHVNGHLHMHLHPTVFRILMENADVWRITCCRLTRESFLFDRRLAKGNWPYRFSHAAIYAILASRSRARLRQLGIRFTERVFGLLQNGRVNESYVGRLLACLPAGDSELYSHPSLDEFKAEFDALISPRVKALVDRLGIRLIRYQDL